MYPPSSRRGATLHGIISGPKRKAPDHGGRRSVKRTALAGIDANIVHEETLLVKLEDADEHDHGADVPFISGVQYAHPFSRVPHELQTGAITIDLGYTIKIDRERSGQRPLITLPDSTRHTIRPLDPEGKHVDSLAEHIFNLHDAKILRCLQRIVTLYITFSPRHKKVCKRQNSIFIFSIASTNRPPSPPIL